jgi:type II restriction/modification system DNA methylase subunit YeeA
MYIIDFGTNTDMLNAQKYELPFAWVTENVKLERDVNRRERTMKLWWLHGETRPGMRKALAPLTRYIITPRVSKYRLFSWMHNEVLADSATVVFARDDDYFFGVLHSRVHELWALKTGTALEDRPRYTPTTCFETFPFPWAPGAEPVKDPQVEAIASAARVLVAARDAWLNPPDIAEAELAKRTLTNLYNQNPLWLRDAHAALDAAVCAAYGWPADLSDAEIIARLLELNGQRAGR